MIERRQSMNGAPSLKLIIVTFISLLLLGCGEEERFSDLVEKMDGIKRKPSGMIESPPKFRAFENYVYGASLMRSPFQPNVEIQEVPQVAYGPKVTPNFKRVKEPLEEFSIESLSMVGTIKRKGNDLFGLIKDSKGGIQRVAVGNYMGKNHGEIIKITEVQIDLKELISDGMSGWIERPRTVTLKR